MEPAGPSQEAQASLKVVCAALDLHPDAGQVERLLQFLGLLQRWNATYNLTAVRDPAAMLQQHLADCLALVGPLARRPGLRRVLDVGSGGGLPGAVIALMRPELDVTCVDAVGKKAAFVRQVSALLGLPNLHGVHARVEALRVGSFDLVTCRAFAALPDFVRWTRRQLAPGGCWLAMKGRRPDDELAALPPDVEVFHVEPLSVPGLGAQRCLVWMRPAISLSEVSP
jgi:16S rRNA (guanine527-N7)-methyltransferase